MLGNANAGRKAAALNGVGAQGRENWGPLNSAPKAVHLKETVVPRLARIVGDFKMCIDIDLYIGGSRQKARTIDHY